MNTNKYNIFVFITAFVMWETNWCINILISMYNNKKYFLLSISKWDILRKK